MMTETQLPKGIQLEKLDYTSGYLVKVSGRVRIEVWRMLLNWRVVTTPVGAPGWPERGWCYTGTGRMTFITAVLAAFAWDGADDTEPEGYFKRIGDDYPEPETP